MRDSLPLLSALVRERILEHALPASASALQQLYPAFRLDMDTIFKCSVLLLDKHTSAMAAHQHDGQTAAQNQLTRFYRKVINLHPKNMLQVVFELAYLFLRYGLCQEAYDHLSTWSVSPFLASTSRAASGAVVQQSAPLQLMHGYLGVVAWECAKQARDEGQDDSDRQSALPGLVYPPPTQRSAEHERDVGHLFRTVAGFGDVEDVGQAPRWYPSRTSPELPHGGDIPVRAARVHRGLHPQQRSARRRSHRAVSDVRQPTEDG